VNQGWVVSGTIARVFPRRTKATPSDAMAFTGPPGLFEPFLGVTEVRVSVAFTWDVERAKRLADAWERIAPVTLGGPALASLGDGQAGAPFEPGRYLAPGYTITSRGCPRNCWFCRVPRVIGRLKELPIVDGWKVQDDNLLACSRPHFEAVMAMLGRQGRRVEFTGGLEALLLQDWHVDAFASLKPRPTCFFAYDPGDAYETLADAARKMLEAGFTRASHRLCCYVLVGDKKDTFGGAEKRLTDMLDLGFSPRAMLWRHPRTGLPTDPAWAAFQRRWFRPTIIHRRAS
jgi:hypothetical protein